MTDQNPLLPEQRPTSDHMLTIFTEAFQEWQQKQKLPYQVEGRRGKFGLGANDFVLMQAIMRQMIIDNDLLIDKRLASQHSYSEEEEEEE